MLLQPGSCGLYNAWMMVILALGLWSTLQSESDAERLVRQLVEKLSSDKVEERDDAARKLTALGRAAVPELERASLNRDVEMAERARRILRSIPRLRIGEEKVLTEIPEGAEFIRAVFSPSGSFAAIVYRNGDNCFLSCRGKASPPLEFPPSIALSPDGQHVAYQGASDGKTLIGLDDQLLYEGDALWLPPFVFSPDSSSLAYILNHKGSQFVCRGKTQGPAFTRVGEPVFRPDGRAIAYAAIEGGQAFVVAGEVRGRTFREIPSPPVYSPDGKSLLYAAGRFEESAIVIGDEVRKIEADSVSELALAPDGKTVAYVAGKDGAYRIVLGREEVPVFGKIMSPLRFTADGKKVAYLSKDRDLWYAVLGRRHGEGFPEIDQDSLALSPDGEKLAYAATRGEGWMTVAGDAVGDPFADARDPIWSPDGSAVAYRANIGGERKDIEALGGRWLIVVGDKRSDPFDYVGSPHFSLDGGSVSFGVRRGRKLSWMTVSPK